MYPYNYQPYQPKQEVIRVNGENGARALSLGPDSSVLVIDETAPIVWLIRTDGAGYKTCLAYDINPHKAPTPQDFTSLEERIKKLEARFNESNAEGS